MPWTGAGERPTVVIGRGTVGQGEWKILQDFVSNPNPEATAQQLEQAAAAAFG